MQPASLVFCERTGRWAAAWRTVWARAAPEMADRPLRIVETRSARECRETLAGTLTAFVAIELTPEGADIALDLLAQVTTSFPPSAAAVLAENTLADYEWLARELGAVHFIASPRQLPSLTGIVCRHAAHTPAMEMGLRESVWSRLPWST
ncbi:MAG TPA: hypothetical protein VGX78_17920 [Pirellulales bacterium]|jgi:hypothetical protein|nr:hypothetical protein [Pirellulales bacterium]